MANFLSYDATQIMYQAHRKLGVLDAGQVISPAKLADGLTELNMMLDSWGIEQRKVWAIRADQYTLTAGIQFYLIGPSAAPATIGGVSYGAFSTARPNHIRAANLILNTVSPPVRQQIQLLTPEEWASIRVQSIPFALPLSMWYDRGFSETNSLGTGIPAGLGAISLWPGPLSSYQLELFTTQQPGLLIAFVDLATGYAFPPGYAEAVMLSYAERAAPMLRMTARGRAIPAELWDENLSLVRTLAAEARSRIESVNAPTDFMQVDGMFMGSGVSPAWNYAIGQTGTRSSN